MAVIKELVATATSLEIDTDFLLSKHTHSMQLLLRLGNNQEYPWEQHAGKTESITVLTGYCAMEVEDQRFELKTGDQIEIAPDERHRFLSDSECNLLVFFETQSS